MELKLNGVIMRHIWNCRRTFIGFLAIICLTVLGIEKGIDVSIAIAGVVGSVAAANSYQRVGEKKYSKE